MKRFIKNVIRLFWYLPYRMLKFLRFGMVLNIPIGWDTLCPLAPYSEGGLLRKDFLELCKKKTVSTEDYQQKAFGNLIKGTDSYEFWERKFANQKYLATWFV